MENDPSPSPIRQRFATIPRPRQKGSSKFCNGATEQEGGGGKGRQMAAADHPGMYGYKGGNLRALKRAEGGAVAIPKRQGLPRLPTHFPKNRNQVQNFTCNVRSSGYSLVRELGAALRRWAVGRRLRVRACRPGSGQSVSGLFGSYGSVL